MPEYTKAAPPAATTAPESAAPMSIVRGRIMASFQGVEVSRHVAAFRFGDAEVGHRGSGRELLRIAYPRDHVVRRVRQNAAEVGPVCDAGERRPHLPPCAGETRHRVTASAAVSLEMLAAAAWIATHYDAQRRALPACGYGDAD